MNMLFQFSIAILCLITSVVILQMFMESYFKVGIVEVIYLLAIGELRHFIHKRRLVSGDLVFIKHHGKNRKAFIVTMSIHNNTVQAKFFEKDLNLDKQNGNWYPLSRIVLPEFLGGKAAKVLYSDLED